MITPDPQKMDDVDKVRALMANAIRYKNTDLENACFRRICELEGSDYSDPLVARLWQAVAAYEECLRKKHNGRAVKASYTRRKIKEKGAEQTLIDWALDTKETGGFEALLTNGMPELTGEYVVVEFADRFDPNVVKAAAKRLQEAGVPLPG